VPKKIFLKKGKKKNPKKKKNLQLLNPANNDVTLIQGFGLLFTKLRPIIIVKKILVVFV